MSPWVEQNTTPTADASAEDEVGRPSGFAPAEDTVDADMLGTPPQDGHPVNDSIKSIAHRLKSFTKRELKKFDSPLIRQPLEQLSPTRPRLPKWSKRLVAQSLSRVPDSKQGEVLVLLCLGYVTLPEDLQGEHHCVQYRSTGRTLREKPVKGRPGNSGDARPSLRSTAALL